MVLGSAAPHKLTTCGRVRVGALGASGVGIVPVRSATRLWGEGALVLRARAELFDTIFVEAESGAAAVMTRDRPFIDPDCTIHHAPPLLGVAGLGAGVSFP